MVKCRVNTINQSINQSHDTRVLRCLIIVTIALTINSKFIVVSLCSVEFGLFISIKDTTVSKYNAIMCSIQFVVIKGSTDVAL